MKIRWTQRQANVCLHFRRGTCRKVQGLVGQPLCCLVITKGIGLNDGYLSILD